MPKQTPNAKATTARNKAAFLKAFSAKACNISEGCKAANVSRKVTYEWQEKDPQFKADMAACKAALIDMAESLLFRNMTEGDTTALIFFLKTQAKDRGYVERQEIRIDPADITIGKDMEGLN